MFVAMPGLVKRPLRDGAFVAAKCIARNLHEVLTSLPLFYDFAVLSMTGIAALILILAATSRWFWRAYRVDIPASPRLFMAAWVSGLLLGLVAWTRDGGGTAAAWAIGLALLMLYLAATGRQKVASTAIKVGDTVPAFTALDEHGAQFDSASLAGSRFLLKFFRGHW